MKTKEITLKELHIETRDMYYQSPENEFLVRVDHITDNVFGVTLEGYLDFESNLYYTGILEMILIRFQEKAPGRTVFFIEQAEQLRGVNSDARNYTEKKIKDWGNYGGSVFIGYSQVLLNYKQALQDIRPELLFHVCGEESEALEVIHGHKNQEIADELPNTSSIEKQATPNKAPKQTSSIEGETGWILNTPDNHFSAHISILGRNTLQSQLKGSIQLADAANYARFIENVTDLSEFKKNNYSHVVDLKEMRGISRQAKTLLKNILVNTSLAPQKLFLLSPPKTVVNSINIMFSLFPGKLDYCEVAESFEKVRKVLNIAPKVLPKAVVGSRIPGGALKAQNKKNNYKASAEITPAPSVEPPKETKRTTPQTKLEIPKTPPSTTSITEQEKQLSKLQNIQEQRIGELSEMIRQVTKPGTEKATAPKLKSEDPFYELFNAVGLMQGYFTESINENKFNFDSLRNQVGLYQRFINNSSEAGLVLIDGRIRMVNKAFATLIGLDRSVLENTQFAQLVTSTEKDKIDSLVEKIAAKEDIPSEIATFLIKNNGEKLELTTRLEPFTYEGKPATLLFFQEIKKEEEPIIEPTTQKLGAYVSDTDNLKFSFLSNISHEIRTPMTAIVGLAEFLTSPVINPQAMEEYVNLIKYNANSLLMLLNDLIDISNLEAGIVEVNPSVCQVNQILDAVYGRFLKLQKESGNSSIELKLNNFVSPAIKLYSDSDRILQVLSNLLSNSFKFTHKGTIEFGVFSISDNKIRFFVRDTGIGIDQDKLEVIFESFKQIDESRAREYAGAGLGLAISQKIALLLEGRIWVASKKGEGSTFYLELPVPDPSELPEESKSLSESELGWAGKTFLIVDDVDSSYHLLASILRRTRVRVLWAKDGAQAIGFCQNNRIDVVLMDIQMPNVDGLEATKKIKELYPDLPVIAQTAYIQEDDQSNIVAAGCDDYIPKPIEKERVYEIINKHLNK